MNIHKSVYYLYLCMHLHIEIFLYVMWAVVYMHTAAQILYKNRIDLLLIISA